MSVSDWLSHRGVPYGIRQDGTVIVIVGFEIVEVNAEMKPEDLYARWLVVQSEEAEHYMSLDDTFARSQRGKEYQKSLEMRA